MATRYRATTVGRRVVVVSQAAVERRVAMVPLFEFEDVLATIESAEIVYPPFGRGYPRFDRSRRIYKAARTVLPSHVASGLSLPPSIEVSGEIDLLVVVVNGLWDLYVLECIPDWRRRARHVVAYLMEAWPAEFAGRERVLEPVEGLDLIVTGDLDAVAGIERSTGRPVVYEPTAVDADRFAPRDPGCRRPVGVLNIGRRSPSAHAALLELAEQEDLLYIYDTFRRPEVADHQVHRDYLGRLMQQTEVAICNYGKFDQPELVEASREIGHRYFEGGMAGALLVGASPAAEVVDRYFGWEDAIFDAPVHGDGAAEVIRALLHDEPRRAAAHRRNTRESLLRHDWAHRWTTVLDHLGLPQTEAHEARLAALQERSAALA